jgi:hypothetical protein
MAPKLTLEQLYGARGAARFTRQAHPKNVRAAQASPNGTAQVRTPRTAPGPQAQAWNRVPGQPIPRVNGFGQQMGFAGPEVDRSALDAKLVELDTAFRHAAKSYLGLDDVNPLKISAQVLMDLTGGNSSIANALVRTYKTLQLLGGDLYQAVIGQHVFPLDDGTAVNQEAALNTWNNLALDTQETLSGILGYMDKWQPLPGLLNAAKPYLNPLKWPWWLQLVALAGGVYYGSKLLGGVGQARSAFRGFKSLPGYQKKRKKR